MRYTRREVGKLALTALPSASLLARPFAALAQAKPNSTISGVRVGAITYSYRTMPDQSAEATLRYIVDSGISQIEFMGGPVEAFAGAPQAPQGGGGRRGGQPPTPEQQAAQREAADKLKAWRTSVSMDRFKALRKMYNDAGVTIYAWKRAEPEHVGRGVRVHLQRGGGARLHAHDAGADRRRRAAQADWRVRGEEEDLRGVSHASAGQHDGVRSGVRGVEGEHGERRSRPLRRQPAETRWRF